MFCLGCRFFRPIPDLGSQNFQEQDPEITFQSGTQGDSFEIKIGELAESENVYVAGAKLDNGVLKTAGGRVLGAVATADNLEKAIENAYKVVDKITFENAYYRKDIGKKALLAITK